MKKFTFLVGASCLLMGTSAFAGMTVERFNCGSFVPSTPEGMICYTVEIDRSQNGREVISLLESGAKSAKTTMNYEVSVVGQMTYAAPGFKAVVSNDTVSLTDLKTGKLTNCDKIEKQY